MKNNVFTFICCDNHLADEFPYYIPNREASPKPVLFESQTTTNCSCILQRKPIRRRFAGKDESRYETIYQPTVRHFQTTLEVALLSMLSFGPGSFACYANLSALCDRHLEFLKMKGGTVGASRSREVDIQVVE